MTDLEKPAWLEERRNGDAAQPKAPVTVQRQRDDPKRFEGLLSDAEKEALRAEAREEVAKEAKDRQAKALYAQYLTEERRASDPKKQLHPIILQLAGHANYIMLDGTQYMTDTVYHVEASVYAVLMEQMNRGWAHEDQTEVRDFKTRRRLRPPPGIGYGNFMDNRVPRNLSFGYGEMDSVVAAQRAVTTPR